MGTCKCGNKTVKFKTAQVKKAQVKKATIKTGADFGKGDKGGKKTSDLAKALSIKATKAATKKAKKNAQPCQCTQ